MTKCPRCFNILPDHISAWTEAQPRDPAVDDAATAYRGHPVSMGRIVESQLPITAAPGQPSAGQQAEHDLGGPVIEVCPLCHYQLPTHWRLGNVTCLAMAGARSTGKTVYIAVMVKQLQRLLERAGREIDPANSDTRQRYTANYEKPLYEERGILLSTRSAATEDSHQLDPLIFSLGMWNGVREFLAIRDVAGEDLEEERHTLGGRAWEFFSSADAVLFLFDPMRVDEIKDHLRDLIPTSTATGGDPRDVLRTVMRLIDNGDPKLAVILSKFDALQQLQKVTKSSWGQIMSNAGAAFARDPGLVAGQYNEDDGLLLHAEVHSLLQELEAGPMLRTMTNPQTGRQYQHRFFAVSALGGSPHGEKLNPSGISPFRCMDPVRWVFAERQVLT
jgi:double-GTPase-like protein